MSQMILATVPTDEFSPADREAVQVASRALESVDPRSSVHVEADAPGGNRQSFVLPASAIHLVTRIMTELAAGRSVSVVRGDAMLPIDQAADMLNVSQSYVVRLLDDGKLPSQGTGAGRRVMLRHLNVYRARRDADAEAAMDFLVAQAQELGLGY